jgi:hypothetical protein
MQVDFFVNTKLFKIKGKIRRREKNDLEALNIAHMHTVQSTYKHRWASLFSPLVGLICLQMDNFCLCLRQERDKRQNLCLHDVQMVNRLRITFLGFRFPFETTAYTVYIYIYTCLDIWTYRYIHRYTDIDIDIYNYISISIYMCCCFNIYSMYIYVQ